MRRSGRDAASGDGVAGRMTEPEDAEPVADADAPATRRPRGGRNLTAAVGSAVVFAVAFLVSAFVNPWVLLCFVAVVLAIAVLELDAALRTVQLRPPTVVVLGVGVALLPATFVYGPRGQLTGLAVLVIGVVLWSLLDRRDPAPLASAAGALLIGLWVPFLASFLGLLLARPDGEWYIIIVVALTAASDIGAYAVGYRVGRHKLAPAVSPGKTWEGVGGGLIAAMVVAGIGAPLLVEQLSVGRALALGALVSIVGVLGDLAESAVKRSLGVKDLGRLLPGHGGMMDRVDAMLFTLPVAHLVLLAGGL
jgi:phosphatidate cytidylyltransferase